MLKVVGASWAQTKFSSLILAVVAALGVVVIILGEVGRVEEDGNYSATVYWSEGSGFRIEYWGEGNQLQEIPHGAARAVYSPRMDTTGWARLEVETHPDYPDWVQAYAAGLLEGSLSWQLVHWHRHNTVRDTCERREQLCDEVRRFVVHNREWARAKAKRNMHKDPFWHQVELFYTQLDGLEVGWREGVERSRQSIELPHDDFLWMNAMSDVLDLERKLGGSEKTSEPDRSVPAAFSSALVKLLPATNQLFVAHNTGARYQSMLRMMKRYHLGYHLLPGSSFETVPGREVVFSSYPGVISSQDDFYVVSGGSAEEGGAHQMVVAGTAFDNFNSALWSGVNTDKVLVSARAMVANRLAMDGRTWAKLLERHSSGTGNKQWVVADYGRLARVRPEQLASTTDAASTRIVRVEAREGGDASTSASAVRLWEVTARSAASHDTHLVLEASRLFQQGGRTRQSEEGVGQPPEGAGPSDAEWPDRPVARSRRELDRLKDVLWVVEQLPGVTRYADKSSALQRAGYWASFGLPYFKEVVDASGTTKMQERHGEAFSLQDSSKATIFRRNQRNATDLASMVALMRSAGSLPDALSLASPLRAVAGRGDLALGSPVGTIDTKVFSGSPGGPSCIHAVAGPPYNVDMKSNDVTHHIKPFQWSRSSFSETTPHVGQPDTWRFPVFTPQWAWSQQKSTKVS
ncbi:putative phospholipase B-like lamina ancestor [Bacillus rossius redtenbacheri]|uniref:putative phospholipase B-like lamina ancestor n=1 Tax=Bacillus rossius redtenbacheri TaxID=93214 RepID=UPI002FDCFF0A